MENHLKVNYIAVTILNYCMVIIKRKKSIQIFCLNFSTIEMTLEWKGLIIKIS